MKNSAKVTTDVLVEALPYIRRFQGKVVVVKYGGGALAGATNADGDGDGDGEARSLASFAEDIVLLRTVGMLPVVVHGGGPQIGALLRRLGIESVFKEGLRVTDATTLDVARMVLVGKVNRDIVSAINVHDRLAVGLSGEDANMITANQRSEALGFVGDIDAVDPTIVKGLLAQGLIPIIATIGSDVEGRAYNINADTVAGAIARAVGAEKLIFLTDVEGIRADADDPATLLRRVSLEVLRTLVDDGNTKGGMIPKAHACIDAVAGGVASAHLLDGRTPHALLLELFTDGGVGTMVVP